MNYNICRIPVYRLTPKEFDLETERIVQYHVKNLKLESDTERQKWYNRTKELFSNYKPQFNEIIIWINICLVSNYILFDVWKKDKMKYHRQQYGDFVYDSTKSIELDIKYLRGQSSREIFSAIVSQIQTIHNLIDKKRYIDLNDFIAVYQYFNWKSFITDALNHRLICD